jgi:hypothetical protein
VLLLTPNDPVPAPHSMLLTMSGVHFEGALGSWPLADWIQSTNSSSTSAAITPWVAPGTNNWKG